MSILSNARKTTQRKLYVPASFDAFDHVNFRNIDAANWFVSSIWWKNIYASSSDVEPARLYSPVLREVMGQTYAKNVVHPLLKAGICTRKAYSKGRSFGYLLSPELINDLPRIVHPVHPQFMERMQRGNEVAHERRMARYTDDTQWLHTQLHRLRIDAGAACRDAELYCKQPGRQHCIIDRIASRNHSSSVGQYGRFFHTASGLKRELRRHLIVGGERLASVDISQSQPLLIGVLMRLGLDGRTPPTGGKGGKHNCLLFVEAVHDVAYRYRDQLRHEVDRYLAECVEGDVYDCLLSCFNPFVCKARTCSHESPRSCIKTNFLMHLVNHRGATVRGYRHPVVDAFRGRFPLIWRVLGEFRLRVGHHKALVRLLQQTEAALLLDNIVPAFRALTGDAFTLTLHDEAFVPDSKVRELRRSFQQVANELEVPMRFKETRTACRVAPKQRQHPPPGATERMVARHDFPLQ